MQGPSSNFPFRSHPVMMGLLVFEGYADSTSVRDLFAAKSTSPIAFGRLAWPASSLLFLLRHLEELPTLVQELPLALEVVGLAGEDLRTWDELRRSESEMMNLFQSKAPEGINVMTYRVPFPNPGPGSESSLKALEFFGEVDVFVGLEPGQEKEQIALLANHDHLGVSSRPSGVVIREAIDFELDLQLTLNGLSVSTVLNATGLALLNDLTSAEIDQVLHPGAELKPEVWEPARDVLESIVVTVPGDVF